MIDHYTNKIQNVIQMELFKAQKSIKIAMAWFTNDLLFQPLLMKLQVGVTVEIILNKDEINDSKDNPVDFNEFINLGGILRWNDTKQLLHEKFCVIDDKVVLSGSYNWTNKAEINDEILTVFREESKTTEFFNKKFDSLSEKYNAIASFDNNRKSAEQILKDTIPERFSIKRNSWTDGYVYEDIYTAFPEMKEERDNLQIVSGCPELLFYDDYFYSKDIDLPKTLYSRLSVKRIVGKKNGRFAVLNNNSFLPETPFCFYEYNFCATNTNIIWLLDEKCFWHIYDVNARTLTRNGVRIYDNQFTKYMLVAESITWELGLICEDGNVIVDINYDSAIACRDDKGVIIAYAMEFLGDQWDYIDLKNELIYRCKMTENQIRQLLQSKFKSSGERFSFRKKYKGSSL